MKETSERKYFSCSGSTKILLGDYCRAEDSTLKLLIENKHLDLIRGLDVEVFFREGSKELSGSASLQIDESKVFEMGYGPNPTFERIEIVPVYLTSNGLETCRPISLNYSEIRECRESSDAETTEETP